MKYALVFTAFLFGPVLFAAQPPDLGHYKGLAFSSATDRHPLEIQGGSLVGCTADAGSTADITKCEVENGSLIVIGTEFNALNVKLERVAVLRSDAVTPSRHYYYQGTTDLKVGEQLVKTNVGVTINVEEKTPNRVQGFIDLPAQAARTSLEAYLIP